MRIVSIPSALSPPPQVNAAAAVLVGAYLAIVLYQGNLGALATAAKQDFLGGTTSGGSTEQPFWRWMAAVLILMFITDIPSVRPYRFALLAIVFVAMLIEADVTQGNLFKNLTSGIATFFGRSNTSGT